jgi:hypothetical protein
MQLYSKQHLLAALEKDGLPHSYKSLLQMEKSGIIPQAGNAIGLGNTNRWRLYTATEIQEIVERVKAHKDEITDA